MSADGKKSGMLADLAKAKEEAKQVARGERVDEVESIEEPAAEEPEVEASAEESEAEVEEPTEENSEDETAVSETDESEEDDGPIVIRGKSFKNQAEAIAYAESLEDERIYNQGFRDAQAKPAAEEAQPPEDEIDDAALYTDPKGTLKKIKESAVTEAEKRIEAKMTRERLWTDFLTRYPDIERKDAERILSENIKTIGAMENHEEGMKLLARKVRSEYQRMADRLKPRTELPTKKGTVVSRGNGVPQSVTPKKTEKVLTMTEQMKSLRTNR